MWNHVNFYIPFFSSELENAIWGSFSIVIIYFPLCIVIDITELVDFVGPICFSKPGEASWVMGCFDIWSGQTWDSSWCVTDAS